MLTLIVTFHSTYWAMEAERALKGAGFDRCRLRPVPRQYSSSCGICAEVQAIAPEEVLRVLSLEGIEHDALYGPGLKEAR